MGVNSDYEDFIEKVRDINRFRAIAGHLSWDQQTLMPTEGTRARGEIISWLAAQAHGRLVDDALGGLIVSLSDSSTLLDEVQSTNVREVKRERQKAVLLPLDHVSAAAKAPSEAMPIWQQARENKDYSIFEDTLRSLVALAKERIGYLRQSGQTAYDVLLDDYEHDMKVVDYDPLFAGLQQRLIPLLEKIMQSKASNPDIEIPKGAHFPIVQQEQFCRRVSESYGFDFRAGRMDVAALPFSAGLWPGDTRFTNRYDEQEPFSCIGAVMHETGHALYEQGLPVEHDHTPRGDAVSLGVHESQSRLWENQIGRSRAYWRLAGDWFRESFDDCPRWSDEELFRLINKAEPSFIRVEADEVTYNLHVMLRYQVEKAIFNDGMDVSDIPAMWNSLFKKLFALEVPDVSLGCLQDVHWAHLAFGYFPTYTLGNLYAAQLLESMVKALGKSLDEVLSSGDTSPILAWLRENIHVHGMRYRPAELIKHATGHEPSPEPFISYVEKKYAGIYGF